jgi:hypothetical protein
VISLWNTTHSKKADSGVCTDREEQDTDTEQTTSGCPVSSGVRRRRDDLCSAMLWCVLKRATLEICVAELRQDKAKENEKRSCDGVAPRSFCI